MRDDVDVLARRLDDANGDRAYVVVEPFRPLPAADECASAVARTAWIGPTTRRLPGSCTVF